MVSHQNLSVMVSAGEASSDAHAAHALDALRTQGVSFVDCRDLAVIGFVDVLINYPKFLKRLRKLREHLQARKPDLLLLVDYPDFNLKLAETAKSLGIPVLFYVSPQVWAWRAGRVPRIGSLVSHMAVLFPFEVDIYEKHGIPVTYVGNPVVADAVSALSPVEARELMGLNPKKPVVTLLPGSRTGEIKRNLPPMIESAKLIAASIPDCQFLLPIAPTLDQSLIQQTLGSDSPANLYCTTKDSRDAMRAGNVALVASGTATLETALIGTPMVVMYIVNKINYAIMKRLIKIPDISLVNIVAGKRVVPEYIQADATPRAMATDVLSLLSDEPRRTIMLGELNRVKHLMGDAGASIRVAQLIVQLTDKG
jgi:lipid-A-disaccharide synthase